jgi:ribokinase
MNAITERLGGGGLLFASAAADAGLHTSLIGRVGRDVSGRAAVDWLRAKGIHCNIVDDETLSTGRSLILRDEARDTKVMVSHRGANVAFRPEEVPEELIANAHLLYISGYSLLEAPQSGAAIRAIEVARSHGTAVMVDLVPHRIFAGGLSYDYRRALDRADALVLELGTARRLLGSSKLLEDQALKHLLETYAAIVLYPNNDVQIVATRGFSRRTLTGYSQAVEKTGYLDKYRAEAVKLIAEANVNRHLADLTSK